MATPDIEMILTVVGSAATSAAGLGWYMRGFISGEINRHERIDQERHIANLGEFRRIFVALTALGWRGGGNGGSA